MSLSYTSHILSRSPNMKQNEEECYFQRNDSFSIPGTSNDSTPLDYATKDNTIRCDDYEDIRDDLNFRVLSQTSELSNAYEYDSDEDLYAEVEYLSKNPDEERRIREILDRSIEYTPNQMNRLHYIEYSQSNEEDEYSQANNYPQLNEHLKCDKYTQPHEYLQTADNMCFENCVQPENPQHDKEIHDIDFEEGTSWKTCIQNTIKPIAFTFFMIYRIFEAIFIRVVAFLTIFLKAMVIYPIVYTSTTYYNWIQDQNRARFFLLIVFILVCLPFIPYGNNYFWNLNRGYLSKSINYFIKQQQINSELSSIINNVKKLRTEQDMIGKLLETINHHDLKNIWKAIDQNQIEIEIIKGTMDQHIRTEIESKLPDFILVHINKSGNLELPSRFYAQLKDIHFWDRFLKQNEEAVKKYKMNQYFNTQQQKSTAMLVTKEDFIQLLLTTLYSRYGNKNNAQHSVTNFDSLVKDAIQNYHQDVIRTADYALESRGAKVIHSMTSASYSQLSLFHRYFRRCVGLYDPFTGPQMAIMASTHVGQCWKMKGSSGSLGIKLSQSVSIEAITVEYPSIQVMQGDMLNAPKKFEVFCSIDHQNPGSHLSLGNFTYDINKNMYIQTFDIDSSKMSPCHTIAINFNSNWGSLEHTDIYRIRVHGTPIGL